MQMTSYNAYKVYAMLCIYYVMHILFIRCIYEGMLP